PWTPWQMFALGLLGFISGLVFRKDIRTKTQRALLCLYGALSTFFIYGGIMDSAYVLMAGSEPTLAALLAAYASGLPFNLIFAGATVVFLLVLTRPILNKLRRIKKKYGLLTG
ncbi:MAG: ECF transporter S component, partial [Eubacteriales bacterium]|nr:ECF transporter S component [Eubacteriales bacterium]